MYLQARGLCRRTARPDRGRASGRLATPDEISAAVLWPCSDAASFATGHALVVGGGQTV
ncbi:SDR family oxidoreductase [Streptomyces canus]|uniref:SDR family oxidoreductase n=1 Tax=Streptomyces canus TaxID=58343 RepID=UPI003F6AA122